MFMDNSNEKNEVVYLYLDDIIPNRFQPRERFDEGALRELAASIKEHGVIQPIIVRKIGDKYEIIAGERRYKASAIAGLTKIPAIIRNLDDKETSKVALLENLQRKNLSAIEEARTYQKILDLDQMTQFELAKTMGKSQPVVANKLRLLTLPDEVQEALLKEQISERHARSLLSLPTSEEQIEMLHKIINNRMTVRETDEEVRKRSTTDNFGLPGLEATTPTQNESTVQDAMPQPTEINLNQNNIAPTPTAPITEPTIEQNKVDTPDIDALRSQAVDINDFNKVNPMSQIQPEEVKVEQPYIPESTPDQPLQSDQPQEQPIEEQTSEEQSVPEKPFIDLEDLLNNTKEVPIIEPTSTEDTSNNDIKEEQPIEIPTENTETKQEEIVIEQPQEQIEEVVTEEPSKEETEELLDKIENDQESLNETLDIEELNTKEEQEPLLDETKEEEPPKEKPLPSVVSNPSINVFDLRLAISDIRDKITELQNKGIQIEAEEIDFEKQYQIIIKIEK